MPLTRLANTIIDGVADATEAVVDEVAKYLGSDLLFYRATGPERLVARSTNIGIPCSPGRATRLARASRPARRDAACCSRSRRWSRRVPRSRAIRGGSAPSMR